MTAAFYISAAIALIATVRVITHTNAVHALLYFVVSLLAVALMFYTIGAPFIAALEVIIYAGAIMVLFLFVIMMFTVGPEQVRQEKHWLRRRFWAGPGVLCAALLGLTGWVIAGAPESYSAPEVVGAREVGTSLFGPYVIAVQLGALLLLSGLIGASHLRRHERRTRLRTGDTKGSEP